jgi:hypothetical protein
MSILITPSHSTPPETMAKRPDEVRSPAKLQNERYAFTRRNLGWQELIFGRFWPALRQVE